MNKLVKYLKEPILTRIDGIMVSPAGYKYLPRWCTISSIILAVLIVVILTIVFW